MQLNSGLPEFSIFESAVSRINPTYGVKPGNDGEDCEAVLKKTDAQAIKDLALQAISDLARIRLVSKDSCTEEEFHDLK